MNSFHFTQMNHRPVHIAIIAPLFWRAGLQRKFTQVRLGSSHPDLGAKHRFQRRIVPDHSGKVWNSRTSEASAFSYTLP